MIASAMFVATWFVCVALGHLWWAVMFNGRLWGSTFFPFLQALIMLFFSCWMNANAIAVWFVFSAMLVHIMRSPSQTTQRRFYDNTLRLS